MKKILLTIFLSLLLNVTTLINAREIVESNEEVAWKINNKFIIPECLIYELYSGDNYEVFYETYFKKKADHNDIDFRSFIENIGMYLNKEVPLNHSIKTGWGWPDDPEISLTKNLSECLSDNPETSVTGKLAGTYNSYKVIKSIDNSEGQKLSPNITQKFISIKLIERVNVPGSMGPRYHYNIYGIINLDGKEVILPLQNEYNDKSIKKN